MKILLFLLLLSSSVSATSAHYHLHGAEMKVHSAAAEHSCGAAERLAADRYDIVINADDAVVNGTPWKVYSRDAVGIKLYHGNPDAFVSLTLWFNHAERVGYIKLSGIDANREACSDEAILEE